MAHQQFLQVIQGLLQPDNNIRKQAENAYNQFVASSSEQSASLLLQLIQQAPTPQMRQLSAVLLRKLVNNQQKVANLSQTLKNNLRNNTLALLQSEQEKVVRRNICHLIAAFAQSLLGDNGSLAQLWSSLLPSTLQLASNSDNKLQESGLFLLSILGEYCPSALRESAAQVFQALGQSFQNNNMTADSSSLLIKGTVCFLLSLESSNLSAGVPLMQPLMSKLNSLLSSGEEFAAREAMQDLAAMAADQGVAKFMSASMQQMVNSMVSIAGVTTLDTETRIVALEIICSLGENRPGLIRKMPQEQIQAIVQLMIKMACELEDAPNDWPNQIFQEMDDDESDDCVSGMALESLGRLGTKLGGRSIVPSAFAILPAMLQGTDWRQRRAGILTIANIAPGSKKMLRPELGKVFQLIIPLMQDPNQRVRFAAVVSIGLLVQVFDGGYIQKTFHQNIVPALSQTMLPGSGSCPRVRGAAANTLITVFRPSAGEDDDDADESTNNNLPVEQYLDGLLGGLVSILQESSNHHTVHVQAMDATAAVATAAGDSFARFYDSFMPAAKGIIMQASSEELRPLRGRTMQCIAKIGSAVGVNRFAADAQQVMQAMLHMQQQEGTFDEDVSMACAQICRAIGTHFTAYLGHCLPPLLSVLSKKIDFIVRQADEIVDTEEEAKMGLASQVISLPGMEGKRITLNVNIVFEQQIALKCLYEYVDELGESNAMAPYCEAIAKAVQPMVTNRYSPQSRTTAALLLPQLLHSAINQPNGSGLQVARQLLQYVMPVYLDQLRDEVNLEVLSSVSEGICDLARYCYFSGGTNQMTGSQNPPTVVIPLEATRTIVATLCRNIKETCDQRVKLLQTAREENYDEEDMEDLMYKLDADHEDMEMLIDAHGYLLKQHGPNFLPFFTEISSTVFGPLLTNPQIPPELKWAGICAYDDVIEHCGPGAGQHLDTCMIPMLESCSSQNALLRQAAVYGVRIVAEKYTNQFSQFVAPVLAVLMTLIRANDSKEGDNLGATENAICALGTICTLYGGKHQSVNLDQILPHFVAQLPIKEDEECAQISHEHLCAFVEQKQSGLGQCLPQVRSVFNSVLVSATVGGGGGNDAVVLATPAVMNRIRAALASLPQ